MLKFVSWPVRRQLLFLAVLLTLPAVGIIIYSGIKARREAFRNTAVETQKLVDSIASEQETVVAAAEQVGSVLAEFPEIRAGHAEKTQRILADIVRISPHFHNITIIDPRGRYVVSAIPRDDSRLLFADQRFFRQAVATRRFSSGEYAYNSRTGRSMLSMGYPVIGSHGELAGVIAICFNLNHFVDHLQRFYLPPTANYIIADCNGTLISKGASNGQQVGKKMNPGLVEKMQAGPERGTEVFTRLVDKETRVVSYRRLTLRGERIPYLYIRSSVSYGVVMAAANREIVVNLLILSLFVVFGFVLAVLIGKRSIVNRVLALESAARQLASGNLRIRVSDQVRGGELGELAQAFDEMAQQLSVREQELHVQASMLEQEVAERQSAEEALLVERNNLKTIFESAPVGMALLDETRRIVSANESMTQRSGQEYRNIRIGDVLYCRWAVNSQGCGSSQVCGFCPINKEIDHALHKGSAVHREELLFHALRDGVEEQSWFSFSVEPLVIEDRRYVLFALDDISDKKRAEELLRSEKEQLAVTLRSIGDGVITTDTEGRVLLMNAVAEQLTGWVQEQACGKPLHEVFRIVSETSGEPLENPVASVLATRQVVELANHTLLVSRDGTERLIADSAAPILDRDGAIIGVVLVFRDTTEKKQIEEELFRARKLDSIGVLAGGIAHDFNNYLTAILGNVSLARMHAGAGEKIQNALASAESASLRARDLTQQLLTFSKGGAPVLKPASIVQIITDSSGFVLRGSNVRCRYHVDPSLWPVEVDAGQMSQVVNNLMINADQAMPEGGCIDVSVANEMLESSDLASLPAGRYLKITIEDHGVGIPDSDLSRIFDPYFTTKPHGSGLGLATVYSIVKNHKGAIRVRSTPGEGTEFVIYLPACREEKVLSAAPAAAARKGQGRVLVMDDEDFILEVMAGMLELLGYQATTCNDGVEACRLYREALETKERFDVVIMDLTVPGGMGGREAIGILKGYDSQICAIVSSGYANDPILAQFESYGFRATLGKPYSISEVGTVMANALGAAQGR